VPIRIGIDIGDIVFDGTEIYGDSVNLASRIESKGVGGSILLSAKLNEELQNHPEISTVSLGHYVVKNVANPIEIFAVENDGVIMPVLSEMKGKQSPQDKTIAVLPFVNMSGQEDNEYFSDGMTDEIINALAKIKNLKVTSRTSSFYFKNKNLPISQIGNELNVATILEGSIRLSGNKMRVTAQLIDVADDFHFWSENFDRSISDIFAVQDEISLLIADKLREHLGHFEIENKLVDVPNIPVDTYKLYLKGRFHLMKLTLEGTEKAISIFEEIIEEQPNFVMPYLDINQGYAYLGTMGLMPAKEAFIKAQPFLDKALELDEELPESQRNLSWKSSYQNWDFDNAYRHILKSIDLRPTDESYLTMSNFLAVEGKFEAALNYIDKAIQLDPFSAMNIHFKGYIYYLQERYEIANSFFEKSLSIKPDIPFPPLYIGEAFILTGRPKEALKFFQNLPDDREGDLTKLGGITMSYAALGDVSKVKEYVSKLEGLLQTDSIGSAMNFLIIVKTILGDYDEAIQVFEQAYEYRLPLILLLYTDPIVKPLRSIPRFQELMQTIFKHKDLSHFAKKKYKRSSLTETSVEEYYTKLEKYISEHKPYLQSNLTLRQLAQMIDINPNSLSELLNEKIGKNFSEYINHFRVESFKKQAIKPDNAHLSMLGLAYESGFNSKTVFNTFFKKETGMTPKQYLKSVL
jgi:TolB-like protein/AraC-like DNA-binding protein/Tfp pilus assembly protein PilF